MTIIYDFDGWEYYYEVDLKKGKKAIIDILFSLFTKEQIEEIIQEEKEEDFEFYGEFDKELLKEVVDDLDLFDLFEDLLEEELFWYFESDAYKEFR